MVRFLLIPQALPWALLLLLLSACATAPDQSATSGDAAPAGDEQTEPTESAPADGQGSQPADSGDPGEADAPEESAKTDQPSEEAPDEPAASGSAADGAGASAPVRKGLGGENLYRLLVADLAGRRGKIDMALQGYLESARETRDPRIAERAARLALYVQNQEAAREAAARWVELAPRSREAHSVKARLHIAADEPAAARPHLRAVVDLTEGGPAAALREIAGLLEDSEHPASALRAVEPLVRENPDVAVGHFLLARLAHRDEDLDRALRHAERAIELDADLTQARLLRARAMLDAGRGEEAFDRLAAAIEERPQDRSLAVGYARLLVRAGARDEAVTVMQRTFERHGDHPATVYTLGLLAVRIEAYQDARIYLQRLVAIDAHTAMAHYYLGRIAQQREQWTEALRHYIKVGRGEHRFDAQLRAAVSMAQLGRVEEARVHLERLNARYEQDAQRLEVARTQARVEQIAGQPEQALKILGDALEQHPDANDLRYTRALIAAQQERFELARGDLEAILEDEPDNALALNALGYMLADRDLELERAKSLIERALEQNPEDGATLDSMGWVLYRMGRTAEALDYLREAWEQSRDPEIAAHLGEVLWVQGEREEARAIWSQGEDMAPENEVLQETLERLDP